MRARVTMGAEPAVAPLAVVRVRPKARREPLVIFSLAFLAYAALGFAGSILISTYNWDGVTRIAQAHGIVYSRDPHLAALGFIWPPLPALTDLPILVLLKPLGLILFTGPLMSAFYGAFAVTQLSEILRRFELPLRWRVIWVGLFGLHKLIAHNATMGLSEAPFLAFLLMSMNGFSKWERDRQPGGLVWAAVGAALALYSRYEALAWTAIMVVAMFWVLRTKYTRAWRAVWGGSVLAYITPTVWALLLWMFMNWDITGNPIYFLVGPGSTATTPDTAHLVGPDHPFYFAFGSIPGSLRLMLEEIAGLAPLLLPASLALVGWACWRRRWSDLSFLALGWSILGFTFLIALRGYLPPWARYFFWAVPGGLLVAGAAYRVALDRWPRLLVAAGTALFLLVPVVILPLRAWPGLTEPLPLRVAAAVILAPEVTTSEGAHGQFDEFLGIAAYLDTQPADTLTMIDASVGSPVVFFTRRPQQLILTTDTDFQAKLHEPGGQVGQMLVPFPTFDAIGRSEILQTYPDMYSGGEPWAQLITEFPGPSSWRLFRIDEAEARAAEERRASIDEDTGPSPRQIP